MTYFHRREPTIIGAGAFHRPVRDGKGWFHSAMVVRQRGGDQGFLGLDPAFELSGVPIVLRRSADCHWKKVLLG